MRRVSHPSAKASDPRSESGLHFEAVDIEVFESELARQHADYDLREEILVKTAYVGPESATGAPHIAHGIRAGGSSADDVLMRSSNADRLSRYRDLVRRARDVFGDELRASLWLSTPSVDFAGQVPLKVAEEDGYSLERLEPVFVRLEHGIDF